MLYGCEVRRSSLSNHKWKQIERIQKNLITTNLKVKSTIPYAILLAKAGMFPIEASAIIRVLSYLNKVENMNKQWWPKLVVDEELAWRKKTWMKHNEKWLIKWDINILECPNTNEEIKRFVLEKFKAVMWTKQLGKKKAHYVKEFNPKWFHEIKDYLHVNMKGKKRLLVVQLRMRSHHLWCETGRWMVAKED